MDNEFALTGNPKVFHLSATRGRNFQGVLLVNAVNQQGGIGFLLDVKKDRHQQAQLKQAAYVDADGKYVALFGDNAYGPGKVTFGQLYSELLAGKAHGPTRSRDHCHFYPGYDGVYWFGSGFVWTGQPPRTTLDHALTGGDAGTYDLISGPQGLTVSPDGVLTWKPDRKHLAHVVKVKTKSDGRTVIAQHAIQVAAPKSLKALTANGIT